MSDRTPIYIKRGDTDPPAQATLSGPSFDALPGNAAVTFRMWRLGATVTTVEAEATIDDASRGMVTYQWQPADTKVAGSYEADWVVAWVDDNDRAHQETFPNDGSQPVIVTDHGGS